MATTNREVLSVLNEHVVIFTGGMTALGIKVSGTWVGTLTVEGATDGVNFYPINVSSFPTLATPASTITANGNFYRSVQNYVAIRVRLTAYTSGNATVAISTSVDATYQNVYQTSGVIAGNSAATNATNTYTQAAVASQAWNLQSLKITVNGQPAWLTSPNVQIWDGPANTGTLLSAFDLPLSGSAGIIYDIMLPPVTPANPLGGYTGTPGNAMTIVCPAAGSGKTCNINATFSAA